MLPQVTPRCYDQDQQLAKALKAHLNAKSWWVTPTRQLIVSQVIMKQIKEKEHNETHWGGEAMMENLKTQVLTIRMVGIIKSIVGKYWICLQNNPKMLKRPPLGTIKKGNSVGDYWQFDFSKSPQQDGSRYLLVLIDTFSG